MTDLAWVAARAIGFALLLQAVGAVLFAERFVPLAPGLRPALARLARNAAAGALAALAVQYLLEPARMAGELSGILDPALQRVLLSSSLGAALVTRAAGLACVVIAGRPRSAWSRGVALAGVALAVGSFVLTGHTYASPLHLLLAPLLLAHLLILAFWFGSLSPLSLAARDQPLASAARLLAAFSALALWLVPVIALAGLAMAWVLLPDLAALGRPYGLLLIGKVLLYALLLCLGALNKLRLLPAMQRGEAAAAQRLRGTLTAEFMLICAALAVTAIMTGFYSPS